MTPTERVIGDSSPFSASNLLRTGCKMSERKCRHSRASGNRAAQKSLDPRLAVPRNSPSLVFAGMTSVLFATGHTLTIQMRKYSPALPVNLSETALPADCGAADEFARSLPPFLSSMADAERAASIDVRSLG